MGSRGNSCASGFRTNMCPGESHIQCCLSGLKFAKLKSCYPQGSADEVKKRLGGAIDADWITNTCAIRMSQTLNCAGKIIPQMGGESIRGKLPDRWNYIFRVKQLSPMMATMFGSGVTTKTSSTRGVDMSVISGKTGILYFDTTGAWGDATGHFDLWDGSMMVEDSHANMATTERYFGLAMAITFWEFPL